MVGRQPERPLDQRTIVSTSSRQNKASTSDVRSADSSPTKKAVKKRTEPSRSYAAPTYSVLPSAGLMHLDGLARSAASSSESLTSSSATSLPDTATQLLARRQRASDLITRAEHSAASVPPQSHIDGKGKAASVRNSAPLLAQPTSEVYRRGIPTDIRDAVRYVGLVPPMGGAVEPYSGAQLSMFPPVELTVNAVAVPPAPSLLRPQARSEDLLRATSRDTTSSAASSSRSSIAPSVSSISTNGSTAIGQAKPKKRKKAKPTQSSSTPANSSPAVNNRLRAPEAGHGAAASFPVNRPTSRTETAAAAPPPPIIQSRPASRTVPTSSQTVAAVPTQTHSRGESRMMNTVLAAARPAVVANPGPIRPGSGQSQGTQPAIRRPVVASPTAGAGRESPPPPAWSPPATTITLAFTPMHAYIAEIHEDPSAPVEQTPEVPPIPNSPPPAFRSRPPSPQNGQSDDENYIPGLSTAAVMTRERGYASSENEIDLICTQGRQAGPAPSAPPSADQQAALLWYLRHWEAWRRQGMSLEERWRRLQASAAPVHRDIAQQQPARAAAPLQPTPAVNRGLVPSAASRRIAELAAADTRQVPVVAPVPRQSSEVALSSSTAPTFPRQDSSDNVTGPDSSAPSSDIQPAKFPSVGSVRRARVKRFEAQRRDSRMLSSVMEAPKATSDSTNSMLAPQSAVEMPMLAQSAAAGPSTFAPAPVSAAASSRSTNPDAQLSSIVPADARRSGSSETQAASDSRFGETSDRPAPQPANTTAATTPPRLKLAQQLAAEVALRRQQASIAQIRDPVTDTALAPGAATVPSVRTEPLPTPAARISPHVQTAPSRLARLLGQHVTTDGKGVAGHTTAAQPRARSPASSALTLPRAPPRVTTDPLSTDNLKRLSKQELHAVNDDADESDSDGSEGADSDDSDDAGDQLSSSDSDSADGDGESTIRKPPSSLHSSSMQYMPPAMSPTRTFSSQEDAQAVAANWRRAEEGRRFSALLSRPLSIKRKPPPVPPKRWGQIWDSNAVRQRIGAPWQSNNPYSADAQLGNAPGSQPTRMPARLHSTLIPELDEESPWETYGENKPIVAESLPTWQTFGQNDTISEEPRRLTYKGTPEDDSDDLDTVLSTQMSPQASQTDITTPTSTNTSPGAALRRNSALRRSSYLRQRPASPTQSRQSYGSRDSRQLDPADDADPPRPRRPLPIPPEMTPSVQDESLRAEEQRQLQLAISASLQSAAPQRPPSLVCARVAPADTAFALPTVRSATARQGGAATSAIDLQTPDPVIDTTGQRRPATASEIDALPVGRVELERRRIDKNGKVKQKLACVGIGCNKCGICLTQFKEDELAVVLPECFHVFHASPCLRTYLSASHVCPTCQSPLV